ncbi:5771_t:CDS:2, partial [Acaulospora colombiana]
MNDKISESNSVSLEKVQGDSDSVGAQPIKIEEASPQMQAIPAIGENVTKETEPKVHTIPQQQATPAVGENAKETEDKVRAILQQPKLTPEERERKKQELIQRQREARQRTAEMTSNNSSGGSISTPEPTVVKPREDLISQAIKFLSSPSLTNVDEEKKVQFLLNKGMTKKEIDIAKERVGTMHIPPIVPPRTYPTVVHAPPIVAARAPMWKKLIYVLILTGAFSALMIAAIKKLLGPMVTAVIAAKQQLYSHQLSLLRKFNEKLSSFVTLLEKGSDKFSSNNKIIEVDDEENELMPLEDEATAPPSLLAPLSTDLANLSERIYIHRQNILKNEAMEDLQRSLTSLTTYLSTNAFSNWSIDNEYSGDSTVEQVKNEIRSIKGSLIGRSNFPKIPVMSLPSSSTSSYSSKKYQSTPKHQIVEPADANEMN